MCTVLFFFIVLQKQEKFKMCQQRGSLKHCTFWAFWSLSTMTAKETKILKAVMLKASPWPFSPFITQQILDSYQTERVCLWQFQIWWNWQKVHQTGRKHCRKRRNCSLQAISPFPAVFSKDLYWKRVNTWACLGNALKTYMLFFIRNKKQNNKILDISETRLFNTFPNNKF